MKCCICGKALKDYGNNPEGAVWKTKDEEIVFGKFKPEDRCCDLCNEKYVIPGRLIALGKQRIAVKS